MYYSFFHLIQWNLQIIKELGEPIFFIIGGFLALRLRKHGEVLATATEEHRAAERFNAEIAT